MSFCSLTACSSGIIDRIFLICARVSCFRLVASRVSPCSMHFLRHLLPACVPACWAAHNSPRTCPYHQLHSSSRASVRKALGPSFAPLDSDWAGAECRWLRGIISGAWLALSVPTWPDFLVGPFGRLASRAAHVYSGAGIWGRAFPWLAAKSVLERLPSTCS